jgi:hypothetical protein
VDFGVSEYNGNKQGNTNLTSGKYEIMKDRVDMWTTSLGENKMSYISGVIRYPLLLFVISLIPLTNGYDLPRTKKRSIICFTWTI